MGGHKLLPRSILEKELRERKKERERERKRREGEEEERGREGEERGERREDRGGRGGKRERVHTQHLVHRFPLLTINVCTSCTFFG